MNGSRPHSLFPIPQPLGAAASVRGDGNGIFAAGAEVWKENVRGYDSSWKDDRPDVRGFAPTRRSSIVSRQREDLGPSSLRNLFQVLEPTVLNKCS